MRWLVARILGVLWVLLGLTFAVLWIIDGYVDPVWVGVVGEVIVVASGMLLACYPRPRRARHATPDSAPPPAAPPASDALAVPPQGYHRRAA